MKEKTLKFLGIFDYLLTGENKKRLLLLSALLFAPSLFSFFPIGYGHDRLIKTEIRENTESLGVYMLRESVKKEEVTSFVGSGKKEEKVSVCAKLAKNVCEKSFVRRIFYIHRF